MLVAPSFDSYLLEEIADRLRAEDRQELLTVTPDIGVMDQLTNAAANAQEVYLLWPDKSYYPIGIVGLTVSPFPGWGSIWMVCTDDVAAHRIAVRKTTQALVDGWRPLFDHGLHCLVDSRNTMHVKWLDRLGLVREDGVTINDVQFIHFTYRRDPNV